jgi:hypothetical protein
MTHCTSFVHRAMAHNPMLVHYSSNSSGWSLRIHGLTADARFLIRDFLGPDNDIDVVISGYPYPSAAYIRFRSPRYVSNPLHPSSLMVTYFPLGQRPGQTYRLLH